MFKTPEIIQPQAHKGLRYTPNQPYHFARELMLVPLVSSELTRVAREMPIVFPRKAGLPQALVGLEPGRNLHVQSSGHWTGRYVPAQVRAYPFRLAEVGDAETEENKQFVVQLDRDAEHFKRPHGIPLIGEDGGPSDILKNVQKVLMAVYKDGRQTQRLVAQLDKAGVLVEQHLQVAANTDQARAITGFRVVDRKAMGGLASETLAELHHSGALMAAYAHLMSLTNLADGLLVGAAQTPTQTDTGSLYDEIFGGGDVIKFDFDS